MVRLDGTGASAGSPGLSQRSSQQDGAAAEASAAARALVAVRAAEARAGTAGPSRRPAAAFLAQLIAAAQREPQARERRRAEPAEAVQAYRAALAATLERNVSRVM